VATHDRFTDAAQQAARLELGGERGGDGLGVLGVVGREEDKRQLGSGSGLLADGSEKIVESRGRRRRRGKRSREGHGNSPSPNYSVRSNTGKLPCRRKCC